MVSTIASTRSMEMILFFISFFPFCNIYIIHQVGYIDFTRFLCSHAKLQQRAAAFIGSRTAPRGSLPNRSPGSFPPEFSPA